MRTPQRDGHVPTAPSATPEANLKRRRFLLALGAGGAASAAAPSQAIAAPVAQQVAAPQASHGYRESQHVRDYYASTRI